MSKNQDDDQNFVILRGVLARDPMFFDGEHPRCIFKVKVTESYQNKDRISFVPCIAWRDVAVAVSALGEGSRVEVKGGINEDSYEKDGVKIWSTKVTANRVEVLYANSPEPAGEKEPYKDKSGTDPDSDLIPF